MKPCPKCGFHNPDDAVCCISCGYGKLDEDRSVIEDAKTENGYSGPLKQNDNKKIFPVAVIILLLVMAVVITIAILTRGGSAEPAAQTRSELQPGEQTAVTANPGGAIPTDVPVPTATFLAGMASPDFCKLEMALLRQYAEKAGAEGLMSPERYEQSTMTCVFKIHDTKSVQDAGHIYVVHKENDGYGIRLEYRPGDERINAWGNAVLLSLDKNFTEEEAGTAVSTALGEGKSSLGVYDLAFSKASLSGMAELRITDRTKN